MRTGRTVLALGALLAAAVFVGRLASFEIVCDVERMKENVRLENARVLSEARDGYHPLAQTTVADILKPKT